MSRVVVFGAGGPIGTAISAELAGRGHDVVGVTRSGTGATVAGDATDAERVADLVRGADAVINAIGPHHDGSDRPDLLGSAAHGLIDGLRKAGVRRLIVVGGAGSLRDGDILHMDSPTFNAAWRPVALAHMAARDIYFTADDLDWTYVSPPTNIGPGGERTGAYRKGGDELLSAPDGTSAISDPDFAIAVADELEKPASIHRQITFAY